MSISGCTDTHSWGICTIECSVQFSHSVVSDSLLPYGLQHARPPCPSPIPELTQIHVHWVGDAIQPSHLLSSPSPAFNLSQHQGLFNEPAVRIRWPKFWVSDSTPVLPMNTRGSSPLWWTGWISLCPRKSRESSPTPQFKRINSSALSFLHGPTLTCIHDHRKNHSLD